MRKYFFGYLFVKIAKVLAAFALLVGVGYCCWKFGQAHLAADAVDYRPSDFLQNRLGRLSAVAQNTRKIVEAFAGQTVLGEMKEPTFTRYASSNSDFNSLNAELTKLDQDRQRMKQGVTSRFNARISSIEEKLRQRAATLAKADSTSAAPSSAPTPTSEPSATPVPLANEQETLYVGSLAGPEIERRRASLENTRQLLILLETGAENPQNRRTLTDAEAQLDQLAGLLPQVPEPIAPDSPSAPESAAVNVPEHTPVPKTFNAEKVANELRANRFQVGAAILSSWELDEAFTQASELVSVESGKCRIASFAVKGIWLSFFGQVGLAILATALFAFLILVFADLTQTLLDTATNTGITAEVSKPAATPRDE